MREFTSRHLSRLSGRVRLLGAGLALVVVVTILALTGNAVVQASSRHTEGTPGHESSTHETPSPTADPVVPQRSPAQSAAREDEIARLRQMAPISLTGPARPRSMTAEATSHPDLYAGEFVKQLLTQDYRTPRAELLAWVQSEAVQTSEPLVIGLVPRHLRDKWAVFSVTDSADGVAPIPLKDEWHRLGQLQGHTTVEVQRVSEPMAWSSAVASGREVTALVTLHTVSNGRARQSVASVAVALNLEGPPVLPDWGFVTVVTYTEIPVTPR